MSVAPARPKVTIVHQIDEILRTIAEPPVAATMADAGERQARRQAILATLQFCAQHEQLFRAWLAERKGGGLRFRIMRGRLCVGSSDDQWLPLDADEANVALERFDAPEKPMVVETSDGE